MKRLILGLAALALVPVLTGCDDEFRTMCENDLGGVVKSDTKVITTTAVDSNGRLIVGTSTITVRFCLKDGTVVAQD